MKSFNELKYIFHIAHKNSSFKVIDQNDIEVFGLVAGDLRHWRKFGDIELLTVGSETLFYKRSYLMNRELTDYIIKSPTSMRTSSFDEKEKVISYASMIINQEWRLVTISKNGAVISQ